MSPGTSASSDSDLAASVVAIGANVVPGVASARKVLMTGLTGAAQGASVKV